MKDKRKKIKKVCNIFQFSWYILIESSVKFNHIKKKTMQTTFFKVISEVSVKTININGMTEHREKERNDRAEKIMKKVGEGEPVACFLVDRNHYNGYEKHIIMDNGVLVVVNNRTEKVITTFLASGGQIGRYWRNLGKDMPRELQYLTRIYRKVGRID